MTPTKYKAHIIFSGYILGPNMAIWHTSMAHLSRFLKGTPYKFLNE